MSRRPQWPETGLVSVLAALTTWVTLLSWSAFHERPGSYLVPLLGMCLLVAAVGVALRALRLPALVVAAGQLVVSALLLHHWWAGDQALLGWLPTAESWQQVRATFAAAVDAAQGYMAPIGAEVTTFAPLMVASGTAVAIGVDLLAAGLRRAPVAGLPLLAVYTAPVSILDGGVSWPKFALAALSFLFLVAAQEEGRLARWGHQVRGGDQVYDSQDPQVSHHAVWSAARKIGFTATGIAVVVPVVVPTLSLGFFGGAGPGGAGDGDPVAVANPLVDMRRDLSRGPDLDFVRIRTEDPDPSYLRLTVLDSFDGEAWRPSRREIPESQRADGPVSKPPGLDPDQPTSTVRWDLEILDPFATTWLPAPYPVSRIDAPGDWRYDTDTLDFASATEGQDARGLRYSLDRLVITPDAEQLAFAPPAPAAVFGPNTELPDTLPQEVRDLAAQVTSGTRSKYEAAVALQQWFRVDGGFDYSLKPEPGNGVDDLVRFLTPGPTGRVGYCEQFAAAMAVMGRALSIPSRVAVGFLRPLRAEDGSYVYSARDLHAWPEMYFEDTGWVRFEPTPADRTGGVPSYTRQPVEREEPTSTSSASAAVPSGPSRLKEPSPGAGAAAGGGQGPWDLGAMLVSLGVAVLAAAALVGPRLLRGWVRRRRWESATSAPALAEAAWAELRDDALDLGVAWDDRVTLRARARALVLGFGDPAAGVDALGRSPVRGRGANPAAEAALVRIVELVERARYARSIAPDAAQTSAVVADVATVRTALAAGVGPRRERRATWWPASLWARWSAGGLGRNARWPSSVLGEPGVDRAV